MILTSVLAVRLSGFLTVLVSTSLVLLRVGASTIAGLHWHYRHLRQFGYSWRVLTQQVSTQLRNLVLNILGTD